jgi:hypothetical protein
MEVLELVVTELRDDLRVATRIDRVVVVRKERRLHLLVVHAVRLAVDALHLVEDDALVLRSTAARRERKRTDGRCMTKTWSCMASAAVRAMCNTTGGSGDRLSLRMRIAPRATRT